MKPEPLKDIEKQCHDFLNCKEGHEMPGYPKEKFFGFYIEKENVQEMIKSAAEWLKNEIRMRKFTHSDTMDVGCTNILEVIDEAFEDVMK